MRIVAYSLLWVMQDLYYIINRSYHSVWTYGLLSLFRTLLLFIRLVPIFC